MLPALQTMRGVGGRGRGKVWNSSSREDEAAPCGGEGLSQQPATLLLPPFPALHGHRESATARGSAASSLLGIPTSGVLRNAVGGGAHDSPRTFHLCSPMSHSCMSPL